MEKEKDAKRKIIWKVVLLVSVMLCGVAIAVYSTHLSYKNGERVSAYSEKTGDSESIFIEGNCTLKQYFVSDVDKVRGVCLFFTCNQNGPAHGEVLVSMFDETTQTVVGQKLVTVSDILNDEITYVGFDGIQSDCKGKPMSVLLEFTDVATDRQLCLKTRFVSDENTDLSVNGQVVDEAVSLEIISAGNSPLVKAQTMSFVFVLLALAFVSSFTILGLFKKIKYHVMFFVVGIGVGFAYLLTSLTMTSPDEPVHLIKAYSVSNHMMGIKDNDDGTIKMREDDANWQYRIVEIEKSYYNTYYEGLFEKAENTELVDSGNIPVECPKFLYYFSALGITVGRLLGLGTVLTFLLGRVFNMIVFLLCASYAVKKMPFAKSVVVVWTMIPLMMQQLCSYSYDCMINAMCILIVAITLDYMYGEKKEKTICFELILLLLFCLLLVPCKGHALTPISCMPLMIVVKMAKQKKEKIKEKIKAINKKVKWLILGGTVLFVLAILAVSIKLVLALKANSEPSVVVWNGAPGYSLGYILNNPASTIKLILNTGLNCNNYLLELFGGYLGWLEIAIYPLFIIPFMFLIVFAAMRKEGETQLMTVGNRIWICFLAALVAGFTAMGMILNWTPLSSNVIEGIQGRYFLPVLVMILVCIRTKSSCLSKNADKNIMLASTFMQLYILTNYYLSIG